MAYSPLVPNANNTVGSDLTAMQENFSLLESAQVVDSGSTADGDYWRFEDGLQVCANKDDVTNSSSGNGYFSWTFPQSFTSVSYISGGVYGNDGSYSNYGVVAALNGVIRIGGLAANLTYSITMIAIGRWK